MNKSKRIILRCSEIDKLQIKLYALKERISLSKYILKSAVESEIVEFKITNESVQKLAFLITAEDKIIVKMINVGKKINSRTAYINRFKRIEINDYEFFKSCMEEFISLEKEYLNYSRAIIEVYKTVSNEVLKVGDFEKIELSNSIKDNCIQIRCTEEEYNKIVLKSAKVNMNITEYLLLTSLKKKIIKVDSLRIIDEQNGYFMNNNNHLQYNLQKIKNNLLQVLQMTSKANYSIKNDNFIVKYIYYINKIDERYNNISHIAVDLNTKIADVIYGR